MNAWRIYRDVAEFGRRSRATGLLVFGTTHCDITVLDLYGKPTDLSSLCLMET